MFLEEEKTITLTISLALPSSWLTVAVSFLSWILVLSPIDNPTSISLAWALEISMFAGTWISKLPLLQPVATIATEPLSAATAPKLVNNLIFLITINYIKTRTISSSYWNYSGSGTTVRLILLAKSLKAT